MQKDVFKNIDKSPKKKKTQKPTKFFGAPLKSFNIKVNKQYLSDQLVADCEKNLRHRGRIADLFLLASCSKRHLRQGNSVAAFVAN